MDYRIVELETRISDPARAPVVHRFDSAYDAMEFLRSNLARDQRAERWYVIDDLGRVLVGPDDVGDMAA